MSEVVLWWRVPRLRLWVALRPAATEYQIWTCARVTWPDLSEAELQEILQALAPQDASGTGR